MVGKEGDLHQGKREEQVPTKRVVLEKYACLPQLHSSQVPLCRQGQGHAQAELRCNIQGCFHADDCSIIGKAVQRAEVEGDRQSCMPCRKAERKQQNQGDKMDPHTIPSVCRPYHASPGAEILQKGYPREGTNAQIFTKKEGNDDTEGINPC